MSDWNVEKVLNDLARIMNLRGISNRELSQQMLKNVSYVNKVINGKQVLTVDVFLKMCKELDINLSDFFDDKMDTDTVTGKLVQLIKKMPPQKQEHLLLVLQDWEGPETEITERTAEERDCIGTGNAKTNNRE